MNTIDQIYRVRGKQVHLQELADLAAVRSESAGGWPVLTAKALEAVAPEEALPQVHALEDAGWTFVLRRQGTDGVKVYLKPGGRIALGTNRLTIRVADGRSDAEARDLLRSHGFMVVNRLKFAPNLYVVEVPAGSDAVEAAKRLAASAEVEFAEPELIESIPGR